MSAYFLLPVNAISIRLPGLEHDGEGPHHPVGAKYLSEIVSRASIVRSEIDFSLLQVINGGLIGEDQVEMEFQEERHKHGQQHIE